VGISVVVNLVSSIIYDYGLKPWIEDWESNDYDDNEAIQWACEFYDEYEDDKEIGNDGHMLELGEELDKIGECR